MKRFIFFLGCLGALNGFGQSSGRVLDASSGQPIVGCIIHEVGTERAATTNIEGAFVWPKGQALLVFHALGYARDTVNWSGTEVDKVIALHADLLNEVKIEEHVGGTELSLLNPQGFQTLNKKELCKAACCNLSESFETNASIDAAFTDAITGTKQIRMLGLDGKYTQVMFDNMPGVRGLASTYGLTYVPGPFIHQIQIAKGAGSVTAGYESIAGQINVAHKSPDNAEKLFLNAYAGNAGRTELNVVWNPTINKEAADWTTSVMVHGAYSSLRRDMNEDGFLDNPLFTNIIVRNDWKWQSAKGWTGLYSGSIMRFSNTSGQFEFAPNDAIRSQLWGVHLKTNRYEVGAKTGYVYSDKPWQSWGSQVSLLSHDQQGNYGYRQYEGQHQYARVNVLFSSRIRSDAHKYIVGVSSVLERYDERIFFKDFPPIALSGEATQRNEWVNGVFAEYTWSPNPNWIIVGGARYDHHNLYGGFVTPRLHARWSVTERASLKLMCGNGRRVANVWMDNVGMLAGNRRFVGRNGERVDWTALDMESAWNSGLIWTQKMKVAHRDASISVDAYRTNFQRQVVVDFETPEEVKVYNLDGKSYSHSLQIEANYEPARRWDVRLAYRWLEVRTQFADGLRDKPLLNRHRAFVNLAYETKTKTNGAKWGFDLTTQWISKKRIPTTDMTHMEHQEMSTYSPSYMQWNAQITRAFSKSFEVYLGGENLTNFMVHDPIVSAENPASETFDSALIWGPVFGRMYYIGIRWNPFSSED